MLQALDGLAYANEVEVSVKMADGRWGSGAVSSTAT